jgi:DeoR/GlpR family transcriptional regulator of sugar metabolism
VATLERLHMDMLFLGTHGIDVESGLTCPNLFEAQTNQAMAAASRRVVVLADHTKWGITAIASTLRLSEIDIVVTDSALDRSAREILADRVGDLIVAPDLVPGSTLTSPLTQEGADEHA